MLIKLGEASLIQPTDIFSLEKLASDSDLDIENRMRKFAGELKVISPKARDFLYFTCVMMHAAEAACLNPDGTPKKTATGEDVVGSWEKVGEGIKWVCNDSSIQPYRNNNRDIFPESELKIAYQNWVGRPLCLDHQSQSVDKIRGIIVDTVWDDKKKRIIALCALDAKNYPDLADKVKTGVANNVSMGTQVGRAICTEPGCHRVARTEKDFCQHMRAKSCYGEINLDLSPMELSLVVSGADPGAKVKHIIASDIEKAAEMLSDYLNMKEASKTVSTQDLESVKEDLVHLSEKVSELFRSTGNEDRSEAVGPTHSKQTMEEVVSHNSSMQMNAPEAIPTYASELQRAILGAQTKLASLQENLARISTNEEPTMTTKNAYFQGTEEPTPGQKKYPVDPMNEKLRLEDKNLQGPPPFPNVGPVDGIYPGDEQTKKNLQRLADEQERAMLRESALKKAKEKLQSKGYFQGTEEPKPGETTYKPDPTNEKCRTEDKQMKGAPPFPEVGDVEGLYGDDLSKKEKLSRASLVARFEKATQPDGRIDKSASRWIVLANDKPILAATVNQITRGNTESLYDAVATKRFGESLLNRIQTKGFQATADALLKNAGPTGEADVANAPPAPAAPPAPEPAAESVPAEPAVEEMGELEPPEDVGGDVAGNPDEIVDDLAALITEMEGKLSDLRDKVSDSVKGDAAGLEEVSPAGDNEFMPGPEGVVEPKSAAQLQSMRKRVNAMLQEGISETVESLVEHANELKAAQKLYKNTYASLTAQQREYLDKVTLDAVKDAKGMLNDTSKLMEAVVKYAHGTKKLETRIASEQGRVGKVAQDAGLEEAEKEADAIIKELENKPEEKKEEEKKVEDKGDATYNAETSELSGTPEELGDVMKSMSSKEDRAKARVKLAQKGLLGFNELSNQAHPGGSADAVSAGNLDVKPNVPGAAFHVYKDLKDAMLGLANMPPRVRKQAETIQEMISTGSLKAEDVDELVSHGVDADAVKYWKAMWGEAKDPESKEFADKLTKEHLEAKKAEEMEDYKARVKVAYEVANQMVARGMIEMTQVESQVSEIMKWNDAGLTSFQNIIKKQPVVKQASVPVVGLLDSGQVILPGAQEGNNVSGQSLRELFDNHWANKKL